jgi:hypothetical protein
MFKSKLLNEITEALPAGRLKMRAMFLFTLVDKIDEVETNDIKVVIADD